jgi:hypothetical protein
MFFSRKTKEIRHIYKGFSKIAKMHNKRVIRSSTFDKYFRIPFTNIIAGNIIVPGTNRSLELFGFKIILEKIEGSEKCVNISLTPIKITQELWDKGKKALVKEIVDKINDEKEPFNYIREFSPSKSSKLSQIYARVDKGMGLEFFCEYRYKELNDEEIWLNLANVCHHCDICRRIIVEKYI